MHISLNNKYFSGLRELVIERDGGCLSCGMSRGEHFEIHGRDITVDHIDGRGRNTEDKNNLLSNLQTLCLGCHGRKDKPRKLTEEQVINIYHVREVKGASRKLCAAYGVVPRTASDINLGKSWSHLTGQKRQKPHHKDRALVTT